MTDTVLYLSISYEEYKSLEEQMREFAETVHKSTGGFYHKSIRIRVNQLLMMEFHGPLVKAAEAGVQDRVDLPEVTVESENSIDGFLKKADKYMMTSTEVWDRRVDFTYRNLRLSSPSVTVEQIEAASTKMFGTRPS